MAGVSFQKLAVCTLGHVNLWWPGFLTGFRIQRCKGLISPSQPISIHLNLYLSPVSAQGPTCSPPYLFLNQPVTLFWGQSCVWILSLWFLAVFSWTLLPLPHLSSVRLSFFISELGHYQLSVDYWKKLVNNTFSSSTLWSTFYMPGTTSVVGDAAMSQCIRIMRQ